MLSYINSQTTISGSVVDNSNSHGNGHPLNGYSINGKTPYGLGTAENEGFEPIAFVGMVSLCHLKLITINPLRPK